MILQTEKHAFKNIFTKFNSYISYYSQFLCKNDMTV